MSELPKGWLKIPFAKEVKQISTTGKKLKAKEYLADGIYPVVDQGQGLIAGYTNDKDRIVSSDIPLVVFGDHTRVLKFINFEFVPGADGTKVLVPNEYYEPKYFYYLLRTLELPDKGYSRHFKFLKECNVKVAPLNEQKRIVEKLDEVLAQVDTIKARLDGIPAILKCFRQSVLAAAVSGKLTEEWRGNNTGGCAEKELNAIFAKKSGKLKLRGKQTNFGELNLFTLPSGWIWTQNYKLAKDASNAICAGPFGTIFKAKDFRDEGIPIIFLRHVKEDGFNQNKPNYMDKTVWEELHQEYSVTGGELLVTKLGDPPGECCIYPENAGVSMVTPDVLKMDVDEQSVERKYLRSYFNSPISTEIIEKLAFGATRLRIDIAMFKGFPVPLPPMDEQKEIVRLVDQYFAFADTIEAQVKKAQARVDNLTQSILAKAFRGELVEQDPNDEPADKLLERIAAVRKEAEALAKAAKKAQTAKKRTVKKESAQES